MTQKLRSTNLALVAALAIAVSGIAPQAQGADLQLAKSSQLTGVRFEDPPFKLPVERNFQMALLGVSSGIGRSCGKMEAYGWRMNQSEQNRVNAIFKGTVENLSAAGYLVTPENVKNQAKDITLFTADGPIKHFIFLWSAADHGLVLNLCETNQPILPTHTPGLSPSVEVFPLATEPPPPATMMLIRSKSVKGVNDKFSPVGKWIGGYTCEQGYTGGTLEIRSIRGENFKGSFKFYPTEKNRAVPGGSYEVYGQYDKGSKRILINPGKWLKHPKGYFNTVIVGSFGSGNDSFSGFFQGIKGCTSFEAHRNGGGVKIAKKVAESKSFDTVEKKKPKKAKKPSKPKVEKIPSAINTVPTQDSPSPTPEGIVVTPDGKPVAAKEPEAAASAPDASASEPSKPVETAAPALQPDTETRPASAPAARVLPVGKIPPGTIPAFVPQPAPEGATPPQESKQ
ncbi:MAG: hypothetical protein PHW76_05840 [Alphaproteobacteria bacterium]|nr:hypothetical protein [Alphaproteobacteria bacterium]